MTYKILFLDIDGTILKPDHTYEDSTKDAINQVMNHGMKVFLATGRPLHEVGDLANDLNINALIGYNGAYAVDQGQTVVDEPMARKTVERFLEIAKDNNHEMILYTSESNYFTSLDSPIVKNFINTFQLKQNLLYTNDVSNQILGATVMNLDPAQEKLYEFESDIRLA